MLSWADGEWDREQFWDTEEREGRGGAPGVPPTLDFPITYPVGRVKRTLSFVDAMALAVVKLREIEDELRSPLPASTMGLHNLRRERRDRIAALRLLLISYDTLVRDTDGS